MHIFILTQLAVKLLQKWPVQSNRTDKLYYTGTTVSISHVKYDINLEKMSKTDISNKKLG